MVLQPFQRSHTNPHCLTTTNQSRHLLVRAMTPVSNLYKTLDHPSPLPLRRLILSQLQSEVTPCIPKADAAPALQALVNPPNLSARTGTGVYFDNLEVEGDSHASQVRYDVQLSSRASELPAGKPLSRPPRLKFGPQMMNGQPSSATHGTRNSNTSISVADGVIKPEETTVGQIERPKKRARIQKDSTKCTNEQQVFLEAALALTACKNSSVPDQQVKRVASSPS